MEQVKSYILNKEITKFDRIIYVVCAQLLGAFLFFELNPIIG